MKLDQKKTINRLVIYFFYDADGIVDRYVPYMLEDINKNCSELFVVCNGKLTPEGRKTFQKLTPNVMVRENKGFDVWAYKTALEHYGWDKLAEYDEVVMMNSTIMGPIYPFSEMFEEMNGRDLDFWGITKYHKVNANPFNSIYGYIPEHIQSHFIVVRQPMLCSPEFHQYWDNHEKVKSYADAVGKHEAIFTKMFADMGFEWDVYSDLLGITDYTNYPLMMCPVKIISETRCPIFKRRSFFNEYGDYISNTEGTQARELMEFLKNKTSYDVDMIWENILRTYHLVDIANALQLDYILPTKYSTCVETNCKTALVIHSYFKDLVEYCYKYALSMPKNCDVYITTDTEDKANEISKVFTAGPWKKVQIIQIKNQGRDVSSLLVGVADKIENYDLVCFMHDKKVSQLDYGIKGYAFSERCFQNLLPTKEFVQNVIGLFESETRMGMLFPAPPNHADYYPTLGNEWGPNYYCTEELFKKLELKCPISLYKEPRAPLGTMFWFRPRALEKLLKFGWKYEDFPKEPNHVDGTLLHGVERIYPFVAQDAGYYSAWIFSDEYARAEINNLTYMLRGLNIRAFRMFSNNSYYQLTDTMDKFMTEDGNGYIARVSLKRVIKSKIPKPMWVILKKIYHIFGGKKWVG